MSAKLVHIINSLEFGGAEMMLSSILARTDRRRFEPVVVLLIRDLTLADRIEPLGVPIHVIGMKPGIPDPRRVAALARLLRRERPDVVHTWMDHSNLIGGLSARLATAAPVVWGIHHSHHVPGYAKRTTLLTVSACAQVSRWMPERIVYCSEHARRLYEQRGFAAEKGIVIPNGFDTALYRPDPSARLDVRREIGVAADTPLVGLVARFDPLKDHATFVRAAGVLKDRDPHVQFLLCGDGVDGRNAELTTLIDSLGLQDRCHLLGPRRDIPRIQASLDILTSSSISEAFPLTVGEAMACGTPCVVTDVGDSALMVGATGLVVPPSDPSALAGAWVDLLSRSPEERARLGRDARRRTLELFDLLAVTRRYEDVYESMLAGAGDPVPPPLADAGVSEVAANSS